MCSLLVYCSCSCCVVCFVVDSFVVLVFVCDSWKHNKNKLWFVSCVCVFSRCLLACLLFVCVFLCVLLLFACVEVFLCFRSPI